MYLRLLARLSRKPLLPRPSTRQLPAAQQTQARSRRCSAAVIPADAERADARRSADRRHRLAHPPAEPRIDGSDHLGQRRAVLPARRHQHRRRAQRPAAAAQHLRPAEPRPRHRHRRPQPARPSRPRHGPHPGAGQRPPPRRGRHPEQRRVAGHQHDPDRPHRARRHRHRRQLGRLRLGRRSRASSTSSCAATSTGFQVRAQAGVAAPGFGANQFCLGDVRPEFRRRPRQHHAARRICPSGPRLRLRHSLVPARSTASSSSTSTRRPAERQRRLPGPHLRPRHPQRHDQFLRPGPDHAARHPNAGRAASASAANEWRPRTSAARRTTAPISSTPDGRLVPQTGTRYGTGIIGSIVGGNGQTGREGQTVSVLPFPERVNFNLLAHYEFSEAFELFIEAKWYRVNTHGQQCRSVVHPGHVRHIRLSASAPGSTTRSSTRRTAPRLPTDPGLGLQHQPDGRLHRATRRTRSGQGIGGPLSAADIAAINAGTYRFVNSPATCSTSAFATSISSATPTASSRGVRGTFNDDWSYESRPTTASSRRRPRPTASRPPALLAVDGRRPEPGTGQIQCRSQFDPTAAVPIRAGHGPAATSRLPPISPPAFPTIRSARPDNSAAVNYFSRDSPTKASLEPARPARASSTAIRASSSSCPAARSASCSAASIGARRPATTNDPFIETGVDQRVSSSATSSRRPSREGSLRRASGSDPEGPAVRP